MVGGGCGREVTAAHYEADLEARTCRGCSRGSSPDGIERRRCAGYTWRSLGRAGTRPIGIPTLEDKILQRAVLMVLEPVYEQDFLEWLVRIPAGAWCTPGAGCAVGMVGLMKLGGGWVIDLDIEDFFGSVDWGHLRSFLDRRVRDGVIRRAIGKWLNAGVMEAGELSHPQRGVPQGGVVSQPGFIQRLPA